MSVEFRTHHLFMGWWYSLLVSMVWSSCWCRAAAQISSLYGWSTRSSSNRSALCESASSHSQLLMADLIWSLPLITSKFFDIEDRLERMLDGREKFDEDSFLFDFSLTQNPRIVLGRSLKRRLVSSFVHTKEKGNPPNPHIPMKYFWPYFSLISHGEELSSFGTQNYSLFMVIAQIR